MPKPNGSDQPVTREQMVVLPARATGCIEARLKASLPGAGHANAAAVLSNLMKAAGWQ